MSDSARHFLKPRVSGILTDKKLILGDGIWQTGFRNAEKALNAWKLKSTKKYKNVFALEPVKRFGAYFFVQACFDVSGFRSFSIACNCF